MRIIKRKALRPVARYAELDGDGQPFTLRLADSRGQRPKEHKAEVVEYLRTCPTVPTSMIRLGFDPDCFDPTKSVDPAVVTDGVYEWRRGLAHYVALYDVYLPPAFEAHLRKRRWKPPTKIDRNAFYIPPADDPTADDLAAVAHEFVRAGRQVEAEAAYRRVLEAAPSHRASLDALTGMLREQDRTGELLVVYGRTIASDPADASAWFHRGTLLAEQAKLMNETRSGMDAIATAEGAASDLRRAATLGHPKAARALEALGTLREKAR
jgi:hypothetical protein